MRGPRDAATVTAPFRFARNSRKNIALGSLAQRGVRHCGACHRETARCVAREPQSRVERLFDVFDGLSISLTIAPILRSVHRVCEPAPAPTEERPALSVSAEAAAAFCAYRGGYLPSYAQLARAGSAESLSVGPRNVLLDWAECLNEHEWHWLC